MQPRIKKVLFRVDSGTKMGYGHYTRIDALARQCATRGIDYRFVTKEIQGARRDVAHSDKTFWIDSPDSSDKNTENELNDASKTLDLIRALKYTPDVVVVDHYDLNSIWEHKLRASGFYLVALDDFSERNHAANLVVRFVPQQVNNSDICGLKYIPISDAYNGIPLKLNDGKLRLLISFGGVDPTQHTNIAIEAVRRVCLIKPNLISDVDVVLPASLSNLSGYDDALLDKFRIHQSRSTLADLMHKCHIVITSGGNTMLESVAAKRITFVVITADNQKETAEYLSSKNAVSLLGFSNKIGVDEIVSGLLRIAEKMESKTDFSFNYSCIDTNGAARLCRVIDRSWRAANDI